MSDKEIAKELKRLRPSVDENMLQKLASVERGRANTLNDFLDKGEFFFELPDYEPELLIWKEASREETKAALESAHGELGELNEEEFERESISKAVTAVIGKREKRGVALWPLRVAVSGQRASPDPVDIMAVLGKHESLARIEKAIKKLV